MAIAGSVGFSPAVAGADGTFDTSLGGSGLLTYNLVDEFEEAGTAAVVDGEGRIVVAVSGRYPSTGYRGTFVARFLPDGTLDTSFSAGDDLYPDGIKDVAEASSSTMRAIAIDSQGRIVLGGSFDVTPTNTDWYIARLNANGTYDTSFGGGDGRINADMSAGDYDELGAIAIDSSDRILASGSYEAPGNVPRGAVARFLPNGDQDPAFESGGKVDPFGAPGEVTGLSDVTIDSSGRIVLSGRPPGPGEFAAVRLLSDGSLDTSFGVSGVASVDFDPVFNESAERVAIDDQGRISLIGTVNANLPSGRSTTPRLSAVDFDLAAVRLETNGSPDQTYGEGGKARHSFDKALSFNDAILDRAGRVVITNSLFNGIFFRTAAVAPTSTLVARFRADGSLDSGFGQAGSLEISRPSRELRLEGITTDNQGRYLLTGAEVDEENSSLMALARLNIDYPTNPPSARPKCGGVRSTIFGNHRRNLIKGTGKRDVIVGLGGNDVIRGLKGNDLICGGGGNDRLIGGPGRDKLIGDKGRDKLVGGPGKDRLIGGKGRDRCLAGKGKGRLSGCERRR